jgi:small-conductance mechanosensitive channel
VIHTNVGSFSPSDRANAISDKIENLYRDHTFNPDSLKILQSETSYDIVYQDRIIMSINVLEAMWFNTSQEELAKQYTSIIGKAIKNERDKNSFRNIIIRIGEVVLIVVGISILIIIINRLFKRVAKKVISLREGILKGLRFRGYQLIDSKHELQAALFLLEVFRWFLILLSLYIMLPLLFSVFPWTKGIAETLISWITTPLKRVFHGIINYLPNFFTILVIGGITHYAIRLLKFIANEIATEELTIPGFYPDWANPTFTLVRVLLYAFSFIIIFPYLPGSDSPIFQGVSVFLGLLFSLGSSSAISNAVAGFVITYMRPFKVGDRIKIGEITGDVIEKTLLVTRVRTIKNEDITIPNSSVLSGHTVNYTTTAKELGLILHSTVTIGYDVPWKQVHQLLIDAASATKGVIIDENRKPFVLQTSLDDFYVSYQINAYTEQSHSMAATYSDLHQNIQDKFNEAGVEIMSPHYGAARDGNTMAIPSNYLPKDYKSPAFNIQVDNKKKDTE